MIIMIMIIIIIIIIIVVVKVVVCNGCMHFADSLLQEVVRLIDVEELILCVMGLPVGGKCTCKLFSQ